MGAWAVLLGAAALVLIWAVWRVRRTGAVSGALPAGLWRERTPGALVGYLYFADWGAVYYMASRIPVTREMFTEKYRIAASCWGGMFGRWSYALARGEAGELTLAVSGEGIGGAYERVS